MTWTRRTSVRRLLRLALRQPHRAQSDMDEEVGFHIAERIEQLVARGWSPDAAREEAFRLFGPFDATMRGLREAARAREERLHMLEIMREAWQDVRLGIRLLKLYPAFAAGAVITLALGIGAASSMFAVVKHSLLSPLPFIAQDRLVFIGEEFKADQPMLVSYPNFVDWRDRARSFDAVEAITFANTDAVLGGDEPVSARIQNVSRGLFQMLGVRPLVGRWLSPDENRPGASAAVMVSEDFWRQHLGATADLSTIKLMVFGAPRAVVGVMPREFRVVATADVWFPLEIDPVRIRGAGNYWVIARLRPGVSLAAARAEMNGIAAQLKAAYGNESISSAVVAISLRDRVIGAARRPLLILLAAAVFVLLVTCVNVAMMLLARGNARMREMAVRVALGSGQWRLVRQAATETLILSTLGIVGGLLIAAGAIAAVRVYGLGQVPRLNELTFDGGVTAFAVVVATAAAVLFSAIPAAAAKRATRETLGAATTRASRPSRYWSVLVAIQAAATVMLVLEATLIVRTVSNILNVDIGYDPRDVSVASFQLPSTDGSDAGRAAVTRHVEAALASAVPGGVVGLASALPTDHGSGNGPLLLPPISDPSSQKEWAAIASTRAVTPGYFAALRIALVRGRMFDANDRDGTLPVALVNQALAAKLWPGQDAIGKQVRALVDKRGALLTVVGVVGDAHDWRMAPGTQIELYIPFAQQPSGYVAAVLRSPTPTLTVSRELRRALHTVDANIPVRISTLTSNINDTMADRRFIAGMLLAFAASVVILTMVGIFGAVSYAVSMRTREIGIRLAVGATPGNIWLGIEGRMVTVVCMGALAGVAIAWSATRALSGILYGLTPHDVVSFVAAPVMVCLAGALAAARPALRAAGTDPSISLRTE